MKIRHNIPTGHLMKSDPITPEYQAEIDRTMERAEVAWQRAERRLEAAERRLAKARRQAEVRRTKINKRQIAELEAMVELRRVEMEQTHRLMTATGFPATARGRKSFRPVPARGGPL